MGIHRSYFEKQALLTRLQNTNASRNPIIELSYGGNESNSGLTKISRYIFKPDLTDLQDKVTNKEIIQNNITSHKVVFKNVIQPSEAKDLVGGKYMDAKRGSGQNVIIYPLTQTFNEGTGFDILYNSYGTPSEELNTSTANWFNSQDNVTWNEYGTFSGITASNIIDSNYLEIGNEDLTFDITSYVNDVLFSGNTNYGLGICYSSITETMTAINRYVITFFSKYTQTYFEPYLETTYNQTINDDRNHFYLDGLNSLYLYCNTPIDTVNSVEIYNDENILIQTIPYNNIKQVEKNTYKIDLTIFSSDYPDYINFVDRWNYTIYPMQYSEDQIFTLYTKDRFTRSSHNSESFHFSFTGLKEGEKISNSSNDKIIEIRTKRLYNSEINDDHPISNIKYRIYTQQGDKTQLEVIPWSDVNKTSYNNHVKFDSSWLIPSTYYLEVKVVNEMGIEFTSQRIRFQIVSEL